MCLNINVLLIFVLWFIVIILLLLIVIFRLLSPGFKWIASWLFLVSHWLVVGIRVIVIFGIRIWGHGIISGNGVISVLIPALKVSLILLNWISQVTLILVLIIAISIVVVIWILRHMILCIRLVIVVIIIVISLQFRSLIAVRRVWPPVIILWLIYNVR